jgi:hypothetical protein
MVLVEFGQVPFEIVQTNEFVPFVKPVTDDVFVVGLVMEEPPAITDQTPIPIVGILEFKVVVEAHIVKSVPALETSGYESTKTETVLVEAGQTPFTTVHSNILFPVDKEVIPEEFNVGVVTDDPPEITDQVPIPTNGIFALSVAVVVQSV